MSGDQLTIVLIGTLDTKSAEYAFLRARLSAAGCAVVVVDAGVLGEPALVPDISRHEVAGAVGRDVAELAVADRGEAVRVMALGAARVARRLYDTGRLHGVLGAGGSNGAHILGEVAAALPVGVPKVVVATVAAGDTRSYVRATDVTMTYPVVDIAGINRISARILANAAAAVAGMVADAPLPPLPDRPLVGVTVFGVTTAGVTVLRERLDELGYEVLAFHATGVGGQSMEALVRSGELAAVADVTTTELADELAGGVCSAGPDRLTAAAQTGVPQVVSLGALDMVNFATPGSVPERYAHRRLHQHNPAVTLMRTDAKECTELGLRIAARLNTATAPVTLFVPERGLSQISVAGGVFADPVADAALIEAVTGAVAPPVHVVRMDTDVNDPAFATAMADTLDAHRRGWARHREQANT